MDTASIRHTASTFRACLSISALGLICGCGGGGGNITEVRVAAADRVDWTVEKANGGNLVIPVEEAFNCPAFRSGQSGETAHGSANSTGKNGASCKAEVDSEGSAWGEFQLGYCFDNVSEKPLDTVIKIKLSITAGASQKGESTLVANPTASGNVIFFIKDSNGRLLRQEELLVTDLNRGLSSGTTEHAMIYDARFEPDTGYYLVIGGRAEVESHKSRAATMSVEVANVSLDLSWRPAGPQSSPQLKVTTAPATP